MMLDLMHQFIQPRQIVCLCCSVCHANVIAAFGMKITVFSLADERGRPSVLTEAFAGRISRSPHIINHHLSNTQVRI